MLKYIFSKTISVDKNEKNGHISNLKDQFYKEKQMTLYGSYVWHQYGKKLVFCI